MKNRIIYFIIFLMPTVWFGCMEEGRLDHIDEKAPTPAQVTNIRVRNTPGGAVLKYDLPIDKNLLYVRAEYEIQPGVKLMRKASCYIDSLVLEGFGDTREYEIKIYSVGKNEKESVPLTELVNPLTPPVKAAGKEIKEAFGGVAITINNPTNANLAVELMADTAKIGYMTILQTFWTTASKATFTVRGLDSIPYDFGIYLRDRWDNKSDTLEVTLTPWFEEFIPKNTWREFPLPGDAEIHNNDYPVNRIWNGNLGQGFTNFHSLEMRLPSPITWDMGIMAKLSRMKFYPRNHPTADVFDRGHPRVFEIWGSNLPSLDGNWDSWILLGRFECVKPSPGTIVTQEDRDYARQGIDFDFEGTPVPVRYIRLNTVSTFNNTSISVISILEVSFWGIVEK